MITGSIVALVTPMHEDGSIDWTGIERLIEMHVGAGTNAIVSVGTTGESATLDFVEHSKVVAFMVQKCAGRMPVIAGTGANSTQEAIELTQQAKAAGADACLLVAPYYNKPTQEGLYQHHMAIADAVDIPQILYNVPGRTACDMLPDTVARISQHDNIIGVKEATGIMERGSEILAKSKPGFLLYSGDDATALELMKLGAKGNVSVTANVAPKQMADLCRAALAGDWSMAQELNGLLGPLNSALFLESNPIPVKWALSEMGLIEKGIRLPMTPLSNAYHEPVRAALQHAGVL